MNSVRVWRKRRTAQAQMRVNLAPNGGGAWVQRLGLLGFFLIPPGSDYFSAVEIGG